jgi:hypothetical protein
MIMLRLDKHGEGVEPMNKCEAEGLGIGSLGAALSEVGHGA